MKTFKVGQLAFFVGIPLKGTAIFSKVPNFGKDKIIKLLLYSAVSIFAQQAWSTISMTPPLAGAPNRMAPVARKVIRLNCSSVKGAS